MARLPFFSLRGAIAALLCIGLLSTTQAQLYIDTPGTDWRVNYLVDRIAYYSLGNVGAYLGAWRVTFGGSFIGYTLDYPSGTTNYYTDYVVSKSVALTSFSQPYRMYPYATWRLNYDGWGILLMEFTNNLGYTVYADVSTGPYSYISLPLAATSSGGPSLSPADTWAVFAAPPYTTTSLLTSFGTNLATQSTSGTTNIYAGLPVTIPDGETRGILFVVKAFDSNAVTPAQFNTFTSTIDDINALYAYGILDHLTPTQLSRIANYNTFIGGGGGDPHILGMDGSMFDIQAPLGHTLHGEVVNLFSDGSVQLNAKIGSPFLRPQLAYFHSMGLSLAVARGEEGLNPLVLELLVDCDVSGQSSSGAAPVFGEDESIPAPRILLSRRSLLSGGGRHSDDGVVEKQLQFEEESLESGFRGEYGEYLIEVVDRENHEEQFNSGVFQIPWKSPFDNSNAIMKIAVYASDMVGERGQQEEQHSFLIVISEDQHSISSSVEGENHQIVEWVNYGNFIIPLQTSSMDEEQEDEEEQDIANSASVLVHRRIDVYVTSPGHSEPHGYIGQSHPGRKQYREEWSRYDALEGEHSDYVVGSGELFGRDFRFNLFRL